MQLPFFYHLELPDKGEVTLSQETSKHVTQVLRMKEGEHIHLVDGVGKLATVRLEQIHKRATTASVFTTQQIESRARKITIAISPLKNANRFEWFLEKAVEIGVSEIIPVLCERTEREHFRHDRMNNILISAMLQSRQAWLPVLQEPVKFEKVVANTSQAQKFVAHCLDTDKRALKDSLINHSEAITLIGPEGDFTPAEIDLALKSGFLPVSLGNTRLRTETAGIVAAVLMCL